MDLFEIWLKFKHAIILGFGGWNLDCEFKMSHILYFSLIFSILKEIFLICIRLIISHSIYFRFDLEQVFLLWLKFFYHFKNVSKSLKIKSKRNYVFLDNTEKLFRNSCSEMCSTVKVSKCFSFLKVSSWISQYVFRKNFLFKITFSFFLSDSRVFKKCDYFLINEWKV